MSPDKTGRYYSGKLTDPSFRSERARRAALARTTLDAHIDAIAARAGKLTSAQRDRLRSLLPASRAQRGVARMVPDKRQGRCRESTVPANVKPLPADLDVCIVIAGAVSDPAG